MELQVGRAAAWMSRLGPAGRSVVCLVLLAAVTGVIALLEPHVPVLSLGRALPARGPAGRGRWGLAYACRVAIAAMLVFNFFFLPPLHTFTLADSRNWFALAVFLVTAVVVSELAARSRRRARESALLAEIATSLLEHGDVDAASSSGSRPSGGRAAGRACADRARRRATPARRRAAYPLVAGGRRVGAIDLDGAARRRGGRPAAAAARRSRRCSGSRSTASGSRARRSRRRRCGAATR